jgi:alkaline phosphatase
MRRLASAALFAAALAAPSASASDITNDRFFTDGQNTLDARRALKPIKKRAKNVILFVGDGMDPTTVAAARIFDGQSRGEEGEENFLSFERFPHLAMAKTYNTDAQTPDSAGTISAMATGVKTKIGVISLTDRVQYGVCASQRAATVDTLGELAERAGLATGVVSTARITHATPAAIYAHAAGRDWESDALLSDEARAGGCPDIARQLIEFAAGDGIDVALGGGRANFLPAETGDPEEAEMKGARRDGRNLAEEWTRKGNNRLYVWDQKGFDAVDPAAAPKLLGLFDASHMEFEADRARDAAGEPSLAEMTRKAIEILDRDDDGFFLLVEGGRIDHAHHVGNAARALKDTQAFSEAVAEAVRLTNPKETLIIVTADHGHTLTFAGYPRKGSDILGLATASVEDAGSRDGFALAGDGKTYTILGYINGPGSVLRGQQRAGARDEPTDQEAKALDYRQQAAIPSDYESHGGQDVTIYARGPRAHLFGGVVEQSYVFHVIDDALRLRERAARRR